MQIAEILSDITSLQVCVSVKLQIPDLERPAPPPLPRSGIPRDADAIAQGPINGPSTHAYLVQGHNEALALVNLDRNIPTTEGDDNAGTDVNMSELGKADLHRAKELVELHYEVKSRHVNGEVDDELQQAREDIKRVMVDLNEV
ncbi:hypothetical protein N7462_002046 [Penicillium macrosclerotiorum]|uniref:uncharacterized protein n=1 Tax=Penicillium macrosclerotiorum TaxID=303699 RepID=UPI002546866C|nr:uncharacterized protein N7462_002046 [Penicillium macrosclerotiorum]KAJ5692623.1 hypothetical protein N7462_002046 [Penicillium macrosclerotiorum]